MFEKEAEEYVRKIQHDVINWGGTEPEERFYNEWKEITPPKEIKGE